MAPGYRVQLCITEQKQKLVRTNNLATEPVDNHYDQDEDFRYGSPLVDTLGTESKDWMKPKSHISVLDCYKKGSKMVDNFWPLTFN